MKTHHKSFKRIITASLAVSVLLLQVLPLNIVHAAQITNRSLTLQAGDDNLALDDRDGGSKPGGLVYHLFQFTMPGTGTVNSVKFEYCMTADGACVAPTGLDTRTATLVTGDGGFTMNNSVDGAPFIHRTGGGALSGAVSYRLGHIINPTTQNQTFFVRINSYNSSDATGGILDHGVVTAATATPIILEGTMPESLVFCTGATIGLNAGLVPDCATASSGNIKFEKLFSPTDTATATSQMAASTNAGKGYSITVNGTTMMSGTNSILAMGTMGDGTRGVSQFGMNLMANTSTAYSPAVGTDIAAISDGVHYFARPTTEYGQQNKYKYVSGDSVANSAYGFADNAAKGTDAQIMTASYIINVPGSQPAGTYTTTLTYICTPTF